MNFVDLYSVVADVSDSCRETDGRQNESITAVVRDAAQRNRLPKDGGACRSRDVRQWNRPKPNQSDPYHRRSKTWPCRASALDVKEDCLRLIPRRHTLIRRNVPGNEGSRELEVNRGLLAREIVRSDETPGRSPAANQQVQLSLSGPKGSTEFTRPAADGSRSCSLDCMRSAKTVGVT